MIPKVVSPHYPASLNISVSLEAPERRHNRLKTLSHTFSVAFANLAQGERNSHVDFFLKYKFCTTAEKEEKRQEMKETGTQRHRLAEANTSGTSG